MTRPRLAGRRDIFVHHHEHDVTEVAAVTRDLVVHRTWRAAGGAAEEKALAESSRVLDALQQSLGEMIADRRRSWEDAEWRQAVGGCFHKSIGLATPLGAKGIAILFPSPADAYAA